MQLLLQREQCITVFKYLALEHLKAEICFPSLSPSRKARDGWNYVGTTTKMAEDRRSNQFVMLSVRLLTSEDIINFSQIASQFTLGLFDITIKTQHIRLDQG